MHLMVMVLNETNNLKEILEKLNEVGVAEVTVIDSRGVGRVICDKIPIFGGLRQLFNDCRFENITVFSVIEEEMITEAIEAVEAVTGNLNVAGKGILFTFPLQQVRGVVPKQDKFPFLKL